MVSVGVQRGQRLEVKAGTDATPQRRFVLEADEPVQAFPGCIQEDDGRIAGFMADGKGATLRSREVSKHKGNLPAKLGPERVNDALELGAVRSARQKHLDDRRLLADDLETAIARWLQQDHRCHDGDKHR
jgi:hypothetical protein